MPTSISPKVAQGRYPESLENPFLIERFRERFPQYLLSSHSFRGDQTITIPREALLPVMSALKVEEPFCMEYLMDLTVVDFLGDPLRFEVVYHLYSLSKNHRLRVKVRLPEKDPRIPSLTSLWDSANWMEREAWDLYGVLFEGHPDLRRILLYPEFEGHPLRKDYPKEREQPRIPLQDYRLWPRPKPPDIR